MKLFKYEDHQLKISEEAYTLKSFRDLIRRDKSRTKDKALQELAYIYFFLDPRSDFSYELDLEERSNLIKQQVGLPDKWEPDDKVDKAMQTYLLLTRSHIADLLENANQSIKKLGDFLSEMDFSKIDKNGKAVYSPNMIAAVIRDIPKLAKELRKVETELNDDMEATGKMRANRAKKVAEDGFDLYK